MIVVAWSYRVVAGCEAAFEALYASDGDWSRLFARSPDYFGTQLLRDVDPPACYITLDRWRTQDAYDGFLLAVREDYSALDQRGDALTSDERRIGVLDTGVIDTAMFDTGMFGNGTLGAEPSA